MKVLPTNTYIIWCVCVCTKIQCIIKFSQIRKNITDLGLWGYGEILKYSFNFLAHGKQLMRNLKLIINFPVLFMNYETGSSDWFLLIPAKLDSWPDVPYDHELIHLAFIVHANH